MKSNKFSLLPLLILPCGFAFIFFNLAKGSLVNSDDAIYAEIIKQILKRGQWLNLYWQDFLYITKPPLFFWIGALSGKVFSLGEFALRLPAAIFGFLTFILVFYHAKRESGNSAAVISSLTLVSFQLFLNLSRRVMLDVPLVFFITLSIIGFLRAQENRKFFYLGWISAGIAFLIKGYVFFPAIIVPAIYFAITKNLGSFRSRESCRGFLLMLIISLPWQIYSVLKNPSAFKARFFKEQIINHYAGDGLAYFKKPFFFYFERLYQMDRFILYFFALAAMIFIAFGLKERLKKYLIFFIWIAVYLIVFSFSKSKLDHYIIGMYPAIALFVGMVFNDIEFKNRKIISLIMIVSVSVQAFVTFAPYMKPSGWEVDSSGEIKRLIEKYNDIEDGQKQLFVYKIYVPAAVFYSKTKVTSIESDQRQFRLLDSIAEFHSTDSVLFVPKSELLSTWKNKKYFYCLLRHEYIKDFIDNDTQRAQLRIIAKDGNYALISNRPAG